MLYVSQSVSGNVEINGMMTWWPDVLVTWWHDDRMIGGRMTGWYNWDTLYLHSSSCLIDLDTSFVLTGGYIQSSFVTQYNANGFMKELPALNTGRSDHGCAAYYTSTNQPVIFRLETLYLFINKIQKGVAGGRWICWLQQIFGHNRSPFVSFW